MSRKSFHASNRNTKSRLIIILIAIAVSAGASYLNTLKWLSFRLSASHTFWDFLAVTAAVIALYQILGIIINTIIRQRKGPEGEAAMLVGFVRIMAGLAVAIEFVYALGMLKTIGVVAAGFAGMLLGWSLQAPVSGLAAWVLITLMRPFRIGDRVLFPSLGLTGDVKKVGLMYTLLDQVGGAIASEEAIGRDILIPNAMLFSQVAINYTPQAVGAFFLDEVVIRITYDSDWDTCEEILLNAARAVTADIIKETEQEPYIRSDIWDYGILMRLRYMTMAKDRPRITHELVKLIFKEVQAHPSVDMAIPYVYSYRKGSNATERRLFPHPEGVMQDISINDIVDPDKDSVSPEDIAEMHELMKNIQKRGLLQPLLVSKLPDGKYLLTTGHLRLQACKKLGWQTVPATIHME